MSDTNSNYDGLEGHDPAVEEKVDAGAKVEEKPVAEEKSAKPADTSTSAPAGKSDS